MCAGLLDMSQLDMSPPSAPASSSAGGSAFSFMGGGGGGADGMSPVTLTPAPSLNMGG
jgi:hypothetical protein